MNFQTETPLENAFYDLIVKIESEKLGFNGKLNDKQEKQLKEAVDKQLKNLEIEQQDEEIFIKKQADEIAMICIYLIKHKSSKNIKYSEKFMLESVLTILKDKL